MALFADHGENPFLPKRPPAQSPQSLLAASRHEEPQEQSPLEDQTLLGSIGHATLSGLSRVGNVLDIPGSMVRDVATFHNPFDQLLSPTTSENRTSGRDLLRETGLAGNDDSYGNWWGGLGAELLLDPLTYVGVGALTKAGKAAQATGKLTKGLGPSIKAGERSLFSVGLPFTEHATHFGTGAAAQKFAGGIDTALGAVANSAPGRMAQGLFNPEAMGQFGALGQGIAKMMHPARQQAAQKTAEVVNEFIEPMRQTRQAFFDAFANDISVPAGGHWRELDPSEVLKPGAKIKLDVTTGKSHVFVPPVGEDISVDISQHVFERLFGLQAELGGDIDKAMSLFSLDPAKLHPELRAQFVNLANDMQKAAKSINEQALAKGGWGGVLNTPEDFEHFARYAKLGDKDYAAAAREFQTIRGSSAHRSDVIGLIPEEIVNRIATDPLARAKNADDAGRAMGHIAEKYGDFLGKGTMLDEAGQVVPRWAGIGEHAEQLVGWATAHPQTAIFLNPKIEDFARYMKQAHIADSTMDVVHALAATHVAGLAAGADLTQMPTAAAKVLLPDYYEKFARMRSKESLEYLATKTGKTVEELRKLAVPHEIALAVQATRNFQEDPRWLGAIGDVLDGFTNFWKQAVTLPFPSFAGRNMASGQYVNASSGLMPTFAHLSSYAQHVKEAFNMLRNGIDPALEKELFTYDVFNPRQLSEGVDGTLYGKYASAQPANPLDWRSTWNEAGQAVDNGPKIGESLTNMFSGDRSVANNMPATAVTKRTPFDPSKFVRAAASTAGEMEFDPRAFAAAVGNGELDVSEPTAALLKHLLDDDAFHAKRHPLKSITLIDKPSSETGWQGRFTHNTGYSRESSNAASIRIALRNTAGEPVSQRQFARILTHELMHNAVTSKLPYMSDSFRKRAEALLSEVRERAAGTAFHGTNALSNVDEFFAEALTQDKFRDFLTTIERSQPRSGLGVFSQFMDLLVDLLNLPKKFLGHFGSMVEAKTALHDVLSMSGDLMSTARKSEGMGFLTADMPPLEDMARSFADRLPSMSGARKAAGFVMGTGAKLNQWVEFLNRVPMYRYLRGQGWDAAQAAKKVKELQIDYSRESFSPFETQVVGRMVPFYKFQRKIAPVILQRLLQNPGGLMGATIRASRLAAGNDPTTPDYIAEGLNIPNPFKTPPAGGSSYLGGFGLPYEQLTQYVASPHVAGRELLSQLNPLVKFPLEMATGQTFFQSGPGGYGRPLEDLDPPIGRTLSNVAGHFSSGFDKPVDLPDWFEHAAANSPATRFISTARQLSDPRKTFFDLALSNLTGVRPIDVSPGAKDAVLRDRSVELMKQLGASKFTRTFFKPDDLAAMSPEDRAKAERLMALQTALAGRAKDRVKAKKQLAAQ